MGLSNFNSRGLISLSVQASSELSAVVSDAQLRVLFMTTTPRGREFSLTLTLSDVVLEPQKSYAVVISRYVEKRSYATGSHIKLRTNVNHKQ